MRQRGREAVRPRGSEATKQRGSEASEAREASEAARQRGLPAGQPASQPASQPARASCSRRPVAILEGTTVANVLARLKLDRCQNEYLFESLHGRLRVVSEPLKHGRSTYYTCDQREQGFETWPGRRTGIRLSKCISSRFATSSSARSIPQATCGLVPSQSRCRRPGGAEGHHILIRQPAADPPSLEVSGWKLRR